MVSAEGTSLFAFVILFPGIVEKLLVIILKSYLAFNSMQANLMSSYFAFNDMVEVAHVYVRTCALETHGYLRVGRGRSPNF